MSSQPIKRETESPQGNHHSGGAPRTPPVVATVGESNSLCKVGAIAPCGAEPLGSTDKPSD